MDPSQPGILVPAERGARIAGTPNVDVDRTRLQLCGGRVRVREVLGPDSSREAEVAIVRARDRVINGVIRGDDKHGPENLFASYGEIIRGHAEERWLVEVPSITGFGAAGHEFRTLCDPLLDVAELGFDGIWFGILAVKLIELGLITPPVGLNAFVASGVSGVPIMQVFKGILWFMPVDLALVGLFIAFPQIVLWLPSLMQ